MKFKSNIELQAGLEDASGSPGTVNQLLSSTVTGTTWIDPTTIVAEAATVVVIACKNTSGATIAKGTPVYQTGTVGATATIEIAPADALISENKLPAIGLLQTALNNNGLGFVVITGELTNFTTSPIDGVVPVTGDKVFVKSGGGLTLTKPTGEGNGIQNMGLVGKVSTGSAGSITVSSIMRTNDVPNLPEGRIWVGNSNTEVSQTVYIDEPNLRLGIGTTSPQAPLHVLDDNGIIIGDSEYNNGIQFKVVQAGLTLRQVNEFGSSDIFRVDINGNVGIGTTSPAEKLEVDGNVLITAALLSNQENTDIDASTSPELVAQVSTADYTAAFFDFVIKKTTNVRSGTVYACHDGTNVEFTETSTNDLGDTSDVTLSVDISGTNMRLLATVTSDDWSVKSLIRAI